MSQIGTAHKGRALKGSKGQLVATDARALAALFKALSDPIRLRLVSSLVGSRHCVHELSESLGLEQSAVSHKLRTLRDAGLVSASREGRHIYYSLADQHVRKVFDTALAHVRHMPNANRK